MIKRKDFWGGIVAVAVVVAAGLVWLAPWQSERAPDVRLETLDGERFALADLRGQPTIVTFWATTCTSCVEEIPHLKELYETFHPRGFEIIAVAMAYDPPEQVRAMAEERDLPYRIVLDREGSIARAFGDIRLTPTTFVLGPDGEILQRRLGMLDMERLRDRLEAMVPGEPVALADSAQG